MSNLNQIEEIEKLYAKPKTYKIGKQKIEVKIMPLGLNDMGLMNIQEDSPVEEISKNMKSLWAVSLGITEDQAEKISIEFMKEMMEAFMDANNFKEEDLKRTGIKNFIKKKQEQLAEKKAKENAEEQNRPA